MCKILGWFGFVILVVMAFSGCATDQQLRTKGIECAYNDVSTCEDSYITTSKVNGEKEFSLSFVEIDDQGHFHSREQLNDVLGYIAAGGDNQDVILFIHGWHHNAENVDDNVINFRSLLKKVAERNLTRKITGVYVGWRGESVEIPLLNSLTFWERKNVSIEVGKGALIELLSRLRGVTSTRTGMKLVMVGHSFGGSVLFSAMKNEIYKDLLKVKDKNTTVKDKDVVILVNPAIEAIPFSPLYDIVEEIARENPAAYSEMRTPKLAVFTSENDWATKYFFTLGRVVSSTLENQNAIKRINRHGDGVMFSQYCMDMKTLGHYEPYVTHKLKPIDGAKRLTSCEPGKKLWGEVIDDTLRTESWVGEFKVSGVKLTHLHNSPAYSPLWVVGVSGEDADGERIIDGHNGIFDTRFGCFVEELLLME